MAYLLQEIKYYIACQDGWWGNEEYDTYEEAKAAHEKLKEINEMEYKSTCISSYTKTKQLLTE